MNLIIEILGALGFLVLGLFVAVQLGRGVDRLAGGVKDAKHEARCAKLLRRCREDGLTRFECEVHLKQWQCYVSEEK
jgi:hypothetical protein